MTIETLLPITMFVALLAMLLLGYPVAFTLAGTALLFGLLGHFLDLFYLTDLGFIPNRIWGIIGNFTLVAVPLFVFMGLTLEKAGIAEDLLKTFSRIYANYRGSLILTVIIVGGFLAASTGIVGATVVTMGVLTLPSMMEQGYDKRLSCGAVAASGTLGQIIPPSIVLVLLGDIMNVDVGDLFIGAIFPGLILVGLYLAYTAARIFFNSDLAPSIDNRNEKPTIHEILSSLLPPLFLMCVVLGSILFGFASPTEAAACGASGALLVAASKKKLTLPLLKSINEHTVRITAMVFAILIGAQFFGVVFRGLGGDDVIIDLIAQFELHPGVVLFAIMLLIFVLGFFLDFLEICFIVIPIVMPILSDLGYSPLWVGILIAINLQTSFLTPPFGFSLFYLKGVAPNSIKTTDIYQGIMPFVVIQIFVLSLVAMFPGIILWLPTVFFE